MTQNPETFKTIQNPNFSIILPGPCNANCSFCFWERDPEEVDVSTFCQNLEETINKLPSQFYQVSLTGGEPTISSALIHVLTLLEQSRRFDKVVLTTNGVRLERYLDSAHFGVVTNVNISRHSRSEAGNISVFRAQTPNIQQIGLLNQRLNELGIESCVNCVITEEMGYPEEFIQFMRNYYFTEATLRKQHTNDSDLSKTNAERMIASKYHRIHHSECPVCRSDLYIVKGVRTWFSASIAEPTDVMVDRIYELVFHPDGKLYADWAKNIEVEL